MEHEDQKVVLALRGTDAFKHVEAGDFVISLRSFQGGLERSHYSGCVSTAYTVLDGSKCGNVDFWAYLFKSAAYIDTLQSSTDGIREGKTISYDQFAAISLPVPRATEQVLIAESLDRETGKIDALVEEQRRLIELLKEKRQAVISHVVTKGLNLNAPMKDSGVESFGQMPAHWTIKRLVDLARPGTRVTYGIVQAGPDLEDGIPYIRTSDMSGEALPENGYLRTSIEIDRAYFRSKVSTGDLIIAIRASVGKSLLVPAFLDGANLTQGTAKFSPGEKCDVNYVRYFLNTVAKTDFERVAKGATFKEITLDMLRRTAVCCPPLIEQRELLTFIEV